MGTDHRTDYRHNLVLETEVHFEEPGIHGMFRCRTQNIGLGGTYLSSPDLPLESAAAVELVFHARLAQASQRCRIHARVTHATNGGAGLTFLPMDGERQRAFRRFLLKAKVTAQH